jgi:biofilm PGA synthesis N-glycosyltransferase PgaC
VHEVVPDNHLGKHAKITIGIPAYNERGRIGALLRDLLRQVDYDADIVVNVGGSTDGTADEVAKIASSLQGSPRLRLITGRERMGKAAALNDIVLHATGDVIVFIDADTLIGANSLSKLMEPFSKDEMIGVVSGNVLSLNEGEGLFSFISKFQRELHHALCLNLGRDDLPPKVNGTFFAARRGLIEGFPHHIVSDDEYASWCAQSLGYKVVYAPQAIVYTKDPTNFKDYIAKRRRILGGHFLLKQSLNYTVPTTNVRMVSASFLKLIAERGWKRLLEISIMALLELLSRFLARYDVVRDRVSYCYRVSSAKISART